MRAIELGHGFVWSDELREERGARVEVEQLFDLWVAYVGKFIFERKRILGGLKAYLRATDHTSSNIISRDYAS
jgi:hypothetical protein